MVIAPCLASSTNSAQDATLLIYCYGYMSSRGFYLMSAYINLMRALQSIVDRLGAIYVSLRLIYWLRGLDLCKQPPAIKLTCTM